MSKLSEGQLARLPAYARTELERLYANALHQEKRMRQIVGTDPSPIEVDPFRSMTNDHGTPLYLPAQSVLRFHVPGGTIDVSITANKVNVWSTGKGENFLTVEPRASNTLWLGFNHDKK